LYTLGINAAFHDPAACLVKDGRVVAAAEEERFTHIKHGKRPVPFTAYELPFHAIEFCLRAADIRLVDVDHVAYSYDPFILLGSQGTDATIALPLEPSAHDAPKPFDSPWEPLFLSYIVNAPRQLAGGAPHHLQKRFRGAHHDGPYRWHFVSHHLAHAASAFHASPFQDAAVLTLDGRGERATTTYNVGHGARLDRLGEVLMPHSLGILYEQVTTYLGFLHSSDEYKVMALASYGKPRYADQFRDIVRPTADGHYVVHPPRLAERFGPPRERGGPFEQRHHDLARSLQMVLEETVLQLVEWLQQQTGAHTLCLAGGVALNCVMNAKIRDRGPFRNVWVQPAAGDSGTALGAALWVDAQERGASMAPPLAGIGHAAERPYTMDHAFLGPDYSDADIESFLTRSKLTYRRLNNIAEETAGLLADDYIIGWFQGAMEFGPRALGARSILASPISPAMQDRLNDIKDREDFRPVAPVVLEEEASNWFVNAGVSPFMLFVYDVRPEQAHRIPAVRHVDGTARVQTINRAQHALYYDLLAAFQRRTGIPVLVNTSFNTRGEPIVCSPRDAVESFWTSPLDALVIGSFLLEKKKCESKSAE
jgi:carbamoyltransferase